MYVCVFMYICTCTCMYVYTHTHIHTHTSKSFTLRLHPKSNPVVPKCFGISGLNGHNGSTHYRLIDLCKRVCMYVRMYVRDEFLVSTDTIVARTTVISICVSVYVCVYVCMYG